VYWGTAATGGGGSSNIVDAGYSAVVNNVIVKTNLTMTNGTFSVSGTGTNIFGYTTFSNAVNVASNLVVVGNVTANYNTNVILSANYLFNDTYATLSGSNTITGPTYITGVMTQTQRSDTVTNTWTINTAFLLGTNSIVAPAAGTIGFTGVANSPTTGVERFGKVLFLPSGDITVTNPAAWRTSDALDSRTWINGTAIEVAVSVVAGRTTNMTFNIFQ
jgi:hypothetical protein